MKKKIMVKTKEQIKKGNKWTTAKIWKDRYITLEQFKESYVKECWDGEVRSGEKYTSLGYYHTRTIVNFDKENRTVRDFIFPLMDGYIDELTQKKEGVK